IHANQHEVNSEKSRDNQFAALDRITLSEAAKFKLDVAKVQSCVKEQKEDAVRASMKEGNTLGVDGTPTMFVNGEMLDGARPASEIRALLDSALQRAGVPTSTHAPATSAAPPAPAPSTAGNHAAQH